MFHLFSFNFWHPYSNFPNGRTASVKYTRISKVSRSNTDSNILPISSLNFTAVIKHVKCDLDFRSQQTILRQFGFEVKHHIGNLKRALDDCPTFSIYWCRSFHGSEIWAVKNLHSKKGVFYLFYLILSQKMILLYSTSSECNNRQFCGKMLRYFWGIAFFLLRWS